LQSVGKLQLAAFTFLTHDAGGQDTKVAPRVSSRVIC